MPPKRKEPDGTTLGSSRQQKKVRIDSARVISVQPTSTASGSRIPSTNSMAGLPNAIDVEKFVETRAFEMNAMQEAMDNTRSGKTHRVWQTLPRHLRRRAASHDVRRVPVRLREKAKAEMDPSQKKTKKRLPKRGRGKMLTQAEEFLRRQRDKTWLETHVWHAKRMKMEKMWGYRLAVHPTEKAFRSSHRASVFGCILHDASYEYILELKGAETLLKSVLSICCDPQGAGPSAVRYTNGARVCDTHLYKAGSYPFGLVCPMAVMWRPVDKDAPPLPVRPKRVSSRSYRRAQRRADKVAAAQGVTRQVWLICHASCTEEARMTVQEAVKIALWRARKAFEVDNGGEDGHIPGNRLNLELAELGDELNVFELFGPKASQVIGGALIPVASEIRHEFHDFWCSFKQLQTSGTVPRGMVIGGEVYDPRLSFPPKNAKVTIDSESLPSPSTPTGIWPTPALAECGIWNDVIRDGVSTPRYKQKDIHDRKSKQLIPGEKLRPLRQDDRIPILLIQRSLESSCPAQPGNSGPRPIHGWTIIFPKGWAMAFLSSLTYTGTRVGGLRERETQRFEAGCLAFPRDFPATVAYETFAEDRAREEKTRWERKPPAKRPSWEVLGTKSPWKPDWEGMLGISKPQPELIPTQRADEDMSEEGQKVWTDKPWILRGQHSAALVEQLQSSDNPAETLLSAVVTQRQKLESDELGCDAVGLYKSALVSVTLFVPGSGTPEDSAILYSVTDYEARTWARLVEGSQRITEQDNPYRSVTDANVLIGYVTSGQFSLSVGRGLAVGAVSLVSYLDLCQQAKRIGHGALPMVKFRSKSETECRATYILFMS